LSKGLSYSAIRIPVVGLIVLTIVGTAAIIPIAVSSPGVSCPLADRSVSLPLPSQLRTEHESFLRLDVMAPLPYLRSSAAESFSALRDAVNRGAGFDFLARCGDILRVGNAKVVKLGTAFNSRHKRGEAFDYNQEDPHVLLVREYGLKGLKWRTYLICQRQDGSMCTKADLHTDNAGFVSVYVFDFSAAAEQFGWERIHAQPGWATGPTKKEFWHYQFRHAARTD